MGDLRPPHLVGVVGDPEAVQVAAERNFRRLKDFHEDLFDRAPWLDGVLLEDVDLAAGATTQIPHKLDRAYRGWWLCGGALNGDYPGEGTSDDSKKFLALTVTSDQTVAVWVY